MSILIKGRDGIVFNNDDFNLTGDSIIKLSNKINEIEEKYFVSRIVSFYNEATCKNELKIFYYKYEFEECYRVVKIEVELNKKELLNMKEEKMRNYEVKLLVEMEDKGFKLFKQGYETIETNGKQMYIKYYILKNKYTNETKDLNFDYTEINKLKKEI